MNPIAGAAVVAAVLVILLVVLDVWRLRRVVLTLAALSLLVAAFATAGKTLYADPAFFWAVAVVAVLGGLLLLGKLLTDRQARQQRGEANQ